MLFLYKNMAYRKRKPYTKKRKSAKKRPMRRKGGKALRRLIKRELARQVENKSVQYFNYDTRLYSVAGANFATNNIFPCGPSAIMPITQGTGQGNRVGNSIHTKKLMLKGTLVPLAYDATFNPVPMPVQIRMVIFYDKLDPMTVPNPTATNDFFQNGSGVKGFANDLVDMWTPVNTDKYRILTTRTFKLGNADYSGTGASATSHYFANNDFKMNANFSLNLTKYYHKALKFNDATTTPSNRNVYCMFYYELANGGASLNVGYMVGLQYMLEYTYEDA